MTSFRSTGRFLRLCAVVAALVLVAAGCGGDEAASTDTSGGEQPSADGETFVVAYEDGFCHNSWRVHARAELEDEIAKHPEVTKFIYSCAQGRLDKFISDVQSLTAQNVDILLTFPDWGEATLPALRSAHRAGVVVVPWVIPVGGKPGEDYTAILLDNLDELGTMFGEYFADKLSARDTDKPVLVGVGGAAGNPWDVGVWEAMKETLSREAPEVQAAELVWADWDPTKSTQAVTALLGKYPTIDALWMQLAPSVKPALDAFRAANNPLPVIISNDDNGVFGEFLDLHPSNPEFQYGFNSARVYAVRDALNVALRAAKGERLKDTTLDIEQQLGDCVDECEDLYRPDMPDSYIPTSKVPPEELKEVLK